MRHHFIPELAETGWLHGWKPNEYTEPKDRHDNLYSWDRDRSSVPEDQENDFIAFVTEKLLAADPTEDKRYFPALCRWFRFGMNLKDIKEASSLLKKYDALVLTDPEIRSDPFKLYRDAGHPGLRRRPVKKNPIDACNRHYDLERFMDTYVMRKKRAKTFNPEGIPEGAKESDIVHRCSEFILYKSEHGFDGDKELILELPTGARYKINPFSISGQYINAEDEDYRQCMSERMMRDIPGLTSVISELIIQEHKKSQWQKGMFYYASILKRLGEPSPFETGTIADAFRTKYEEKFINLERRKKEDAERPQEDDRYRYHRYGAEKEHPYASSFHGLYDDLATLSHFPKETALIDGEFIGKIFQAAANEGAIGSTRRSLTIINTVSHWSKHLTAKQIAPIFNALAPDTEGRMRRDAQKYLTQLMTFVATTPHWRDGSEAEHLPLTIGHILKNNDWASLKKILHCASRPNNPVSAQWREAIPRELRARIKSHAFDNTYKAHRIHLLMKRIDDLDAGKTRMYRLNDMADTDEAQAFVNKRANDIRRRRSLRKPESLTA